MMDELEFAEVLGFDTAEDLMASSERIVREGDIGWFITALPDGRWAAWDDAELSLDRVEFFETRQEAIEFHRDAYVCTLVLDNFLTERGGRVAVRLPWDVVENLLGGYDEAEEDGEKLISLLREMPTASGWPKWLDNPTTRIVTDDAGCWFVGPRVETAKKLKEAMSMTRAASVAPDTSPPYSGAELVGYDKDPAVTYWLKGPGVYYMREKEHAVESGWYCWASEWPERARRLNIRLVEKGE